MGRTLLAAFILIFAAAAYYASQKTDLFEGEEKEIKTVLGEYARLETERFADQNSYTEDIGDFSVSPPHRPTVAGAFPDCKRRNAEMPHVFIGPADHVFKSQARKAIKEVLAEKCVDSTSAFTIFVAQDLDGDSDLELWTIDQSGKTTVVLKD